MMIKSVDLTRRRFPCCGKIEQLIGCFSSDKMDPVDKTFDTVYHWGQVVTDCANKLAKLATEATQSATDAVWKLTGDDAPIYSSNPARGVGKSVGLSGLRSYVKSHKLLSSGAIALTIMGIAGYHYKTQSTTHKKRRRAARLPNGARKDVVLIVGSVTEPLTRYIANDLENRGFIVYITSTNSQADMKFFQNESIQDIKSLIVSSDFNQSEFNQQQIHKFDYLLSSEHIPFQGAEPNKLDLVGIVFVPQLYFPGGKFHLLPSSTWTNSFQSTALLPLSLLSNGLIGLAEKHDSNVIFITPMISESLSLPYHSFENITNNFLKSISTNLANDYEDLNITNLKLGSISVNSNNNRKNFGIRGEPLKNLHYKIFDLINSDNNRAVDYVGFGARFLHYFAKWIPRWLIRNYFSSYFSTN